jgi:hypothetical protein
MTVTYFFSSTGISGTVPRRFLLQTFSNTTTLSRHHYHHFPTLSLEHLCKPILNCLPSPTLQSYSRGLLFSHRRSFVLCNSDENLIGLSFGRFYSQTRLAALPQSHVPNLFCRNVNSCREKAEETHPTPTGLRHMSGRKRDTPPADRSHLAPAPGL